MKFSCARFAFFLLTLVGLLPGCANVNGVGGISSSVKIWEEQVKIPTYLLGPAEINPQFFTGGSSQGAQQKIYPYPAYDNLTTEKVDKPYKMVYLENEYLKIGMLPESGGKIFEAIDKTNGYHFFYRQHVIKPALISLLGAWISGGVEWDLPHHHRATSFIPVQYKIEKNADGSATCWVGELELRDRMRWTVGVTLYPGKSYLEAKFRMINRTPLPVSMLCFSNVAVHVNDKYQIIFPPSTQWGTGHGKRDYTRWPISEAANGTQTDLSWYANIPGSRSVFAWNYFDDFMAGYDHGKQVGVMSVADHNVVPGKKFFTWGAGPAGRSQDTLLSDNDGPYIELMVGAYSDNQPDYSWMMPFETRQWSQFWYPFRGIGGVKKANTDAAVNLEVKDGKIHVGFYTTSRMRAEMQLKLGERWLLGDSGWIDPATPYVKEIPLPAGCDLHDLRAILRDGKRELIAYSPIRVQPEPQPYAVAGNPYAQNANLTNEELYLTGLRADQFRAPGQGQDPTVFWKEAIRRDPGDIRCNTAMGIHCIRAGLFSEAEAFLRKALERATASHTTPKDGEPFYYLGLALKMQGRHDEAFNQFSRATWSGAWCAPAYFGMAQIASLRGDYAAALEHTEKSLETNSQNTRALALQAALLDRISRHTDARIARSRIEEIDPLEMTDIPAIGVTSVLSIAQSPPSNAVARFPHADFPHLGLPDTGLEAAADFISAGLWTEAESMLKQMESVPGKLALTYYYRGYVSQQLKKPDAVDFYRRAAAASTDYVFPFQMEMIPVFEAAMVANPRDSHAPYYLGNLLYDTQPERAIALWKKSAELGADFAVVYRNLAFANSRLPNAAALRAETKNYLEKAASLGGSAMVFYDLDRYYEEEGVSPEKRLALLDQHKDAMTRDEIIARKINLLIFAGRYDEALTLLNSRFFRAWEGGGRYSLGDTWVNLNLLRGHRELKAGRFKEALAVYQAATEMPANLQEAVGTGAARRGDALYWVGIAQEKLGDTARARQAWTEAGNFNPAAAPTGGGRGRGVAAITIPAGQFSGRTAGGGLSPGVRVAQSPLYHQALAAQKLGDANRARTLFQQLLDAGNQAVNNAPNPQGPLSSVQRVQVADAYCLVGLGQLGLGNREQAMQSFDRALQASPDHLLAKIAKDGLINP